MESIRYSDLVIDDGAIQKLISELGQLRQTYERDVQAIVTACQNMKAAINGMGGGSGGGSGSALARQMSEIDKLKAKYDELNDRYKKNDLAIEQYKARIAELQQQMKAEAKAQLENSQNARQAAESYNRLAALYTRLKIELNKYSQEEISNNKVLLDKQKQAEATMEKMKALQAATGRHTLDVGNYSKALNGLGLATQQIVREAPSLAMSFNQFFLAISNNIPIFTDAFKRVKEEMGSTRIALMQTLKSLFSWQTAMVLGLTLLSKFGNEIIKWAGSVLGFGKAFDAAAEGLKAYNETMSKVSGQMAESSAELETYIYVLENGNKTEAEQAEIVQLVNEKYGKQIEYLGLTIDSTQSLISAKGRLIELLVREAEARGVLNKITELSGKIAERETSEELKNLRGAVERTSATFSQMQVALNDAFGGAAGQGMQSAHIAMVNAQKDLENYNKETEVLIDHLGRLRDKALEINWGTLLGGDGGGGKGDKSVRNRDLEFIRAAQDAALEATQESIFKETVAIRLEYTRRIEDLRTYLAEQRKLKEDEREITVAGETAILNQIKSLLLVMDKEIADAWFEMLSSQVGDLTRTLDAETDAFAKALDDMDRKALKSSLGKTVFGDKSAEKALQLKYQQRQSEIRLSTFGDKDAQKTQLRGAEIEYKEGLLELWQKDATKTTWEIERLRNEIELLKKEASEEEGMSWFEKLQKKLGDIFGKRGLKDLSKGLQQTVSYVMEQFQTIAQARVDLANTMVEQSQRELDATKSTLDQEIAARANGYANNVALAQQEYLEKQRINEQALAEQQAAVEAQERLNTIMQVTSLITASAQVFSSFSGIPVVGIPLAIEAIATMFGAFAAAKVQANQLAAKTYGEGGTELLSGGSHQSGRDIPLGTMPDGRERRAEGGEYLAVINKRSSRKYGSVIPAVIDALNAGVFEQKYGNAFRGDAGLVVNVDGSTDAIERFHDDMKKAMGRKMETRLTDGTRVITYGHTRKIIRS